jgi:predicted nuclease with TOPRIM domain
MLHYATHEGAKRMLIVIGKDGLAQAVTQVMGGLAKDIANDLQGIRSVADLSHKVRELRTEVEKMEIEKARKQEEFDRREREVEHKVGLERKRSEMEHKHAVQEATLKIREENLAADRKRFEEQMAFHEKRFTEEVGYLKDMIGTLAERLPTLAMTHEVTSKRR